MAPLNAPNHAPTITSTAPSTTAVVIGTPAIADSSSSVTMGTTTITYAEEDGSQRRIRSRVSPNYPTEPKVTR